MILNHYAAPLARRDSWLQRIEVYDDYAESPYERVAALLRQMGLHADTIGMEKTYVSAARWEEMQHLVPGARLVDCTELMAQVRWVKTPEEIQLLKAAADILDAEQAPMLSWPATWKPHYVRLVPLEISGRRFRFGPAPTGPVPTYERA